MKTALLVFPWFLCFIVILFLIKGMTLLNPRFERAQNQGSLTAYSELEGSSFYWSFEEKGLDTVEYKVRIRAKRISYQINSSEFGMINETFRPQCSKISKGIYFLSWNKKMGASESVVINLNKNTVHAHIEGLGKFYGRMGKITCNSFEQECPFMPAIQKKLLFNNKQAG